MTRQHTRPWAWLLALVVATGFSALGFWQLQRMHAKEALLAQMPPDRAAAATLAQAARQPATLRWVHDRLHFLPATVLLDNQLRDGRPGLKVYQAAQADAQGTVVLVDLGWLPMPGTRDLPAMAPLRGEVDVQGLWAPPPSPGIALGPALADTSQTGVWLATRLEPAAVAAKLGVPPARLATHVLRLDPALPLGHVRDLELLPNTLPPARHLGYAVQWFGLALAVLIAAALLHRR